MDNKYFITVISVHIMRLLRSWAAFSPIFGLWKYHTHLCNNLQYCTLTRVIRCICSAQSENLRNLEIVLRILRIPRLRTIVAQSRDCAIHLHNLDCASIAHNLLPRRACAETISWLQEKLLKNGDFVSVLQNSGVQAMIGWLSLVKTKPALLET